MNSSETASDISVKFLDRVDYRHIPITDKRTVVYGAGFIGRRARHCSRVDEVTPRYSIDYLLSGTGTYIDWNGKAYSFAAGHAFQRFPGRKHSTIIDDREDCAVCCLVLQESFARALIDIGFIDPVRPVLHPGFSIALIEKYAKLRTNFGLLPEYDTRAITTQALDIIADVYALDGSQDQEVQALLHRASMVLSEDLHQGVDIHEVAAQLGISYHWFRKLFRKHKGISPHQYRIQRRLEAAARLLTIERQTIKQAAMALGYPDVPTFSRQFKKVYGLPPGAYRKQTLP